MQFFDRTAILASNFPLQMHKFHWWVILADGVAEPPTLPEGSKSDYDRRYPRYHMARLRVSHPGYRPMDLPEYLGDRLYIIRMVPNDQTADGASVVAPIVLSDIRVRSATRSEFSVNAGSALKTFEVVNTGDVPCDRHGPCSPDGKWKAAVGGASLDAGENNSFHDVRVSCIAGPCPFTKIEKDSFSNGGRHIGVTIRNWSDTTTFLLEAEVTHITSGDAILQSFPAIFDRTLSFTLPASAQGPSLEATDDGKKLFSRSARL